MAKDGEAESLAEAAGVSDASATADGVPSRKPPTQAAKDIAGGQSDEHEKQSARRSTKKAAKARKKAARAERKAAKAAGSAKKPAEKKPASKKKDRKKKAARDPHEGKEPARAGPSDRARELAGRAGVVAATAGSVLSEVAGLVRQAAEPAASRIVKRVTQWPGDAPSGPRVTVRPAAPVAPRPQAPMPVAPAPEALAVPPVADALEPAEAAEDVPTDAPEPVAEAVEPAADVADDTPTDAPAPLDAPAATATEPVAEPAADRAPRTIAFRPSPAPAPAAPPPGTDVAWPTTDLHGAAADPEARSKPREAPQEASGADAGAGRSLQPGDT